MSGHEPCGEIAAVGPDCRRFAVGDRVILYHIVGCGRCAACAEGYMLMCEEAAMPSATTTRYKVLFGELDLGVAFAVRTPSLKDCTVCTFCAVCAVCLYFYEVSVLSVTSLYSVLFILSVLSVFSVLYPM